MTRHIDGYWDAQGTELDLVAVDEHHKRIRFATCKRSAYKLLPSLTPTDGHIARFLQQLPHADYTIERVAIAPRVPSDVAAQLRGRGWLVEDLDLLTEGF